MKILKFGGTSLGDAARIRHAAEIAGRQENCVVVCSAMAGVTNKLEEVNYHWQIGENARAADVLQLIQNRFEVQCRELFPDESHFIEILMVLRKLFQPVHKYLQKKYKGARSGEVLALGEIATSRLFHEYLNYTGISSGFVNITGIIQLNAQEEPVVKDITKRMHAMGAFREPGIYITQGFICRDSGGRITNLKRGGSDYTATLLGAALHAGSIEIWTDIDGLHNNDPRFIQDTLPIPELSYAEAAELAYFGAKILHPSCVWPARESNIPILLKNTFQPEAQGTLINSHIVPDGIRAVAAKDNITIIRVASGRMFNAYGFLKNLFAIFDRFRIPVDVVTTSEVSVSLTIEDTSRLEEVCDELRKLGRVSVESRQAIVCIVGNINPFLAEILHAVKPFHIRMVSLGASANNVTLVLPYEQKVPALMSLQNLLNHSKITTPDPCIQLQA
ncbi:MAG: aspartate kinase [Bacteroidetes bacterium]|nr:MAG: aspartate kinase [Bacteroidota bacterium]